MPISFKGNSQILSIIAATATTVVANPPLMAVLGIGAVTVLSVAGLLKLFDSINNNESNKNSKSSAKK